MYGIFTYIYHRNQPTVGKYTIHGWYGYLMFFRFLSFYINFSSWVSLHGFTTCCFSAGSTVFVGPFIKRHLDVLLGMILARLRHQNTWSLGFKYGIAPK